MKSSSYISITQELLGDVLSFDIVKFMKNEVSIFDKDAQLRRLSNYIDSYNGYPFKSADWGKDYSNSLDSDNVPVLKISNIKRNINSCVGFDYVSEAKYNNPSLLTLKKDDIVIAMSGSTVGKFGIIEFDKKCFVNQRVLVIRVKEGMEVLSNYLIELISVCTTSIIAKASGLGLKNISDKDYNKFKIQEFPSLQEQQRTLPLIQSRIKIIEDKIKKLEIEKNKYKFQNKIDNIFSEELNILMPTERLNRYNSFGDYSIVSYSDFNGFGTLDMTANYKFELVDELSKKHKCDSLESMTSYLSGGRGYAQKVNDYTECFRIMPKDMSSKDGYLNHNKLDNMSKSNYEDMINTRIKADDIMMSVFGAGAIGRIVYNKEDVNAVPVNNIVATIRANERIDSKFLFYYLYSFLGQQQILRCITGTTGQVSLSLPRVKNILVPVFNSEKQQEIVDIIENYGTPDVVISKINELQSIIDNDLNQYILNGYTDDLFTMPKEDEK